MRYVAISKKKKRVHTSVWLPMAATHNFLQETQK